MKEWIVGSSTYCDLKPTNARIISKSFQIRGVYDDASDIIGRQQKKPIYVCKNAIMMIFNFGYFRFKSLKDDIENSSVKSHGLKNRSSNRILKDAEKWNAVNGGLQEFFEDLCEQAETHSTHVVREETRIGERNDDDDVVDLPSLFT